MPTRDYLFADFTISLCSKCRDRADAKVILKDGKVYLRKHCLEHGTETVLIATDVDYWRKSRTYLKPGDIPHRFNTQTEFGCPWDCGLCPDHEQHSCLTVLELTDRCNLTCPTCYAGSGPTAGRHRTMEEIERMLDAVVRNEGEPDIVQLSGGEPTLHPQFFEVVAAAKRRPIRHLMLNTNGIRIAREEGFAEQLAAFQPGFEVYLQFDSLQEAPLRALRGADLREVRRRALERLNAVGLSTTLVVTLRKGLNDGEMGDIIRYALEQPCVRGVTFQPTQAAGRNQGFDPATDRITLTEVRSKILEQCDVFAPEDIVPVPCNPDNLAMAYALKVDGKVTPLTSHIDPNLLLDGTRNTIVYEGQKELRDAAVKLFSTSASPEGAAGRLKHLLCCLPGFNAPKLTYANVFRVIIMQFLDIDNFDVRSVKKSCVHMVTPEGKLIPFDTMNLFYRDGSAERFRRARKDQMLGVKV
jgi:7,8-dihydro-6-hydroxymethylpterin dimethyltransferase